jgi:SAM-dependent methyltransferase
MKESDNTHIDEFDRFKYPASSTSVDRYMFANSFTKGKTVLDAATGYGYGAGILLSLGAKSVVGIDIDEDAIKDANKRFESPKATFQTCDIYNLTDSFKEDEFEVCTSIETFEHLPPEKLDEYLQSLRKVTSELIFITTPKRKTKEWVYDGGTHLYEYDPQEFLDALNRNFPNDNVGGFGIIETPLRSSVTGVERQWGSAITSNLNESWVMVGVIQLNK